MADNRKAFRDTIAWSEIGPKLLATSDDGYNVLVGGTLFSGYADHPRKSIWLPKLNVFSTGAGRYQILARYFDVYRAQLKLPDFGHASQDAIAMQLIGECKALPMIDAGHLEDAVHACSSRWASFPGAGYGQHEHTLDNLRSAFVAAGGVLA